MAHESQHLSQIMEKHNRIANMQVVFTDIEKYSMRRTQAQIDVIDALMQCMKDALASISKTYIEYSQSRALNFQSDIITLPTGDGAATVFTFDGLHDIHLSFALSLLESAQSLRDKESCAKFKDEGWCNCHPYFNLRIGISEGKGIIFKDLREQYNVAGGVVNMSARIMGLGDRNQIMFTQEGYNQIVDMVDDPHLVGARLQYCASMPHYIAPELLPTARSEL
jgi:class 3 adenylate cyclase